MGKKKEVKQPELRQIIGFTKPKKILFFKLKPKPMYPAIAATNPSITPMSGLTVTAVSSRVSS